MTDISCALQEGGKCPPPAGLEHFAHRIFRIGHAGRGIYFLYKNGVCVYVGQTRSLYSRLAAHESYGKKFDTVYFLPCPNANHIVCLHTIETVFINLLKPAYNKEMRSMQEIHADVLTALLGQARNFVAVVMRGFRKSINEDTERATERAAEKAG